MTLNIPTGRRTPKISKNQYKYNMNIKDKYKRKKRR